MVHGVADGHGTCVDEEAEGLIQMGEPFFEFIFADRFFNQEGVSYEHCCYDNGCGGSFPDDMP